MPPKASAPSSQRRGQLIDKRRAFAARQACSRSTNRRLPGEFQAPGSCPLRSCQKATTSRCSPLTR